MATSTTDSSVHAPDLLEMGVANMTFMLEKLHRDCAPLQYLRELTENSRESILALASPVGEIRWDIDDVLLDLGNQKKLCIIDTGIGMTGPEMVNLINKLSSSMNQQSAGGNFGIGAKIAAVPRNPAGMFYFSWRDGNGAMIRIQKEPNTGKYGLVRWRENHGEYWCPIDDAMKPECIDQHGTKVVLLGHDDDEDTMIAPSGAAMPSRWILRYLNSRYFRFPKEITVKAREGWDRPRNDRHNFLREIKGQKHHLDEVASSSGTVVLGGAEAHWWILREDADTDAGHFNGSGHVAVLFQDELYEMVLGRAGVARLQAFGIIFGCKRVVLYIQPMPTEGDALEADTSRSRLFLNGDSLPWEDWAIEFRDKMPDELFQMQEEIGSRSAHTDHRQAIRDRLRTLRDLFRFSKYRPARSGQALIDGHLASEGSGQSTSGGHGGGGGNGSGGRGGSRGGGNRAGSIYSIFASQNGSPATRIDGDDIPDCKWITVENNTREQGVLEDRAAQYIEHRNLILINGDFRVFTDMIDRWKQTFAHAPASSDVVIHVVREWFEQQIIETVMSCHAIRDTGNWSSEEIAKLWSEESLTAAVMPRYHLNHQIKRSLTTRLGRIDSN